MRLFGAGAMESNFQILFESAPDASLMLAPDRPRFTILAVTEQHPAARGL